MIKTFCDRCGKEITQYQETANLTYKLNKGFSKGFSMGIISELCIDCWHEFLKWMENKD